MLLERYKQGFATALDVPGVSGTIRANFSDFQVDEQLGFVPSGEGEHCFLLIRKQGENTETVARQIARFAGVPAQAVSYSGMKDRNAITTQWFGVHLPKRTHLRWSDINSPSIEVIEQTWHQKKLRRGVHQSNHFRIVVSALHGDLSTLEQRLRWIQNQGVPNYFGEQRFGLAGQNLLEAERLLLEGQRKNNRHQRGLYYSAARSLLFNCILSERVVQGTWNQSLPGDLMQIDGSQSFFCFDGLDECVIERVAARGLHPTGPLWGKDGVQPQLESLAIERKVLEDFRPFCVALEENDLVLQRRSLRLLVDDLEWAFAEEDQLVLTFKLTRGGFATVVLQELLSVTSA